MLEAFEYCVGRSDVGKIDEAAAGKAVTSVEIGTWLYSGRVASVAQQRREAKKTEALRRKAEAERRRRSRAEAKAAEESALVKALVSPRDLGRTTASVKESSPNGRLLPPIATGGGGSPVRGDIGVAARQRQLEAERCFWAKKVAATRSRVEALRSKRGVGSSPRRDATLSRLSFEPELDHSPASSTKLPPITSPSHGPRVRFQIEHAM